MFILVLSLTLQNFRFNQPVKRNRLKNAFPKNQTTIRPAGKTLPECPKSNAIVLVLLKKSFKGYIGNIYTGCDYYNTEINPITLELRELYYVKEKIVLLMFVLHWGFSQVS